MVTSAELREQGYIVPEQIASFIDTPLIPQRSDEWFALRHDRITGSVVDTIVGNNPFGDVHDLVLEKAGMPSTFHGNEATEWGTLHEPIAIAEYEKVTGRRVVELGLTPHRTCPLLAHSPDGISLSTAGPPKLLEVKCPFSRKIKAGVVPPYYLGQLQLGLDTFDLQGAHFVQFRPAKDGAERTLDITTVVRDESWLPTHLRSFESFWSEVEFWRANGWQRHPKLVLNAQLHELRSQPWAGQ